MSDLLKSPRIQELLTEVGEAESLQATLSERSDDAGEVREALDDLYRELGRAVYRVARASRMVPEADADVPTEGFTNEVPDPEAVERSVGWYTEDVEVDSDNSFFDPGDLDDMTEIPESDPMTPEPAPERAASGDDDTFELETIHSMRTQAERGGTPLAKLRGDDEPTWKHNLDEFLELLALPDDFDAADAVSVETSRVQWAASELETRLSGLPEEVQVCVVGMLAARCQHLRNRIDVDVGLRLSLDRLQRYRIQADLPSVGGLLPTPRTETGSWASDVRGWWSLLRP